MQEIQSPETKLHVGRESSAPVEFSSPPLVDKLPQETVLVVDDDEEVRKMIRACLEPVGYNVLEARFNSEALLLCQRHQGQIHLMVADVLMPGMSGPDFAVKVMSVQPEMKVIYISGGTLDAVENKLRKIKTSAFLSKPFDLDTLLTTVRQVLQAAR